MAETKRIDIFGSFLTGSDQSSRQSDATPPDSMAAATGNGVETSLLDTLSKAQAPVDLKSLVVNTDGSVTQILQVLGDMEKFNLVERAGDGAAATFRITDLGSDLTPA